MIKIAVCDDEAIICYKIISLLNSLHKGYDICEFHNGDELMKSFSNFNIVILDIEMPGENGMQIAKNIRQHSTNVIIIFLTSHIEFIHTAFKVKAFRYLSKPIAEEDLFEAVTAAEKEILGVKNIVLKIKDRLMTIKLTDIIYLEAFGDGTCIHTTTDVYMSGKPLNYLLSQLKSDIFLRIHKSFVVSFNYIESISDVEVQLIDEKGKIPISRRRLAEFKKEYLSYIKNNSFII